MDSFQSFVQRWSQPAILVFLLSITWGAIQWGNKLTDESIQAAKERGAIMAEVDFIGNKVWTDDSRNIAAHTRQAEILKAVAGRLEAMENRNNRMEARIQRNESWITGNQNHGHSRGE